VSSLYTWYLYGFSLCYPSPQSLIVGVCGLERCLGGHPGAVGMPSSLGYRNREAAHLDPFPTFSPDPDPRSSP
jgi:hypothetical protein